MKKILVTIISLAISNQAVASAQEELCRTQNHRSYSEYNMGDLEDVGYVRTKNVDPAKHKLTALEFWMLMDTYKGYEDGEELDRSETLKSFIQTDGSFRYYKTPEGNLMVIVVSYPGDNSAGTIYELEKTINGKLFATPFASVGDDDISCFE